MGRSGGIKRKSQALLDSDSDSDASGSGSDLEKEMLSLSKKKKTAQQVIKKMSGSDLSGSDSDWGAKSKGKKSKKKKVAIKKSRRTTRSSDEDDDKSDSESFAPPTLSTAASDKKMTASDLEEGEVSSESDDSDSESEFDDGYDDNLMGDEEDKKMLSMMTEKEREQEIFKRVEAREAMKTRYDIEKKLRQAKKKEQKRLKKAELASSKFKMDAKERSKERKKTVEGKIDKKTQAMDELKARREARKERAEEKARIEQEKKRDDLEDELDIKDEMSSVVTEKSTRKKLKASDIYSDDSGSDWDTSKPGRRERDSSSSRSDSDSEPDQRKKPVYVSTVDDLRRIQLSRLKIEKWVHYPFFERLAKGCFVKIGIGQNVREQKSVYRIAEVLEVYEGPRVYSLGPTRTNKAFKVRHGIDEKTFRFEFISTQTFTQEEFTRWMNTCVETKVVLPTLDEIEKKEKEIKDAGNYQFKDEDVEHIIQEKQKFKQSPVNYAVRKTQLMKEKEQAQQRGEEEKVEELTREIAELDEKAKQLDKARSQSIQSISYINERNRKKNVEQAEKAIMEEIKATKGKRAEDPFTRRNTKPMPMVVNRIGQVAGPETVSPENSQGNHCSTPTKQELSELSLGDIKAEDIHNDDLLRNDDVEDEDNENLTEQPLTPEALKDKPKDILLLDDLALDLKPIDLIDGNPRRIVTTGDLFSAHDFDIQLELDGKLPPNLPIVARPSIQQIQEPPPRRSLNLEDYKRKRGLI